MDGREWMRVVGGSWNFQNGSQGVELVTANSNPADFIEITGYFSHCNFLIFPQTNSANDVNIYIDGTDTENDFSTRTTTASPLGGRYVNGNMLVNLNLGSTTLGLHTLKIGLSSTYMYLTGCELIAQDTTSTANRSKIQIPSQNVVSYGKKFSVSAAAEHYNPFAFKTDGTTAWTSPTSGNNNHNGTSWPVGTGSSHNIDTATSLGLEKWKHGDNYYRPYNGGRVVIWVANDGTIKTSVNVMPPNARSIGNSATLTNATAKANASIANNTFYPTMEAGTDLDVDGLSEVAKSYYVREFGNGAANGGTGGSYADASMLSTDDHISYVMDDGLTSMQMISANAQADSWFSWGADPSDKYICFIGSGITITSGYNQPTTTVEEIRYPTAQNLPYGTHIMAKNATHKIVVDGIELTTGNGAINYWKEFTFHQPKKPPVPEDACILADYMLMADFVPSHTAGMEKISKGSRLVSSSRDFYHDTANGGLAIAHGRQGSAKGGFVVNYTGMNVNENGPQLTWFGDAKMVNEAVQISDSTERSKHYFDGSTTDVTVTSDYTDSGAITTGLPSSSEAHYCVYGTKTSGVMGKQISKFVAHPDDTSNDWLYYASAQVATPIHTSSHYQSFETPYLHELVGGDRNMEQNNLVVTPDGKSWDQVTRDTSYLGPSTVLHCFADDVDTASAATYVINTIHRGGGMNRFKTTTKQKNLVWGYDRMICLVDGYYKIMMSVHKAASGGHDCYMYKNGSETEGARIYCHGAYYSIGRGSFYWELKRGDYIQVKWGANANWTPNFQHFYAEKIG